MIEKGGKRERNRSGLTGRETGRQRSETERGERGRKFLTAGASEKKINHLSPVNCWLLVPKNVYIKCILRIGPNNHSQFIL